MNLNEVEKEVLRQFIAYLNDVCPKQIRSVILYGSKARGDAHPDSDIDILLLVNDRRKINRDKIYDFIVDAELEKGIDISLNIYNADEFNRMVTWQAPFAANVAREGETLWTA
ncbi:MAG: nucleotidyltransferase domain-containing protein [Thermoanaerobacteraceae bacterium]|nr:nucleotidyltransferase domain-containing protein [Thermoanaerobacteraceae bacterium]